jgi:hypothetical protein
MLCWTTDRNLELNGTAQTRSYYSIRLIHSIVTFVTTPVLIIECNTPLILNVLYCLYLFMNLCLRHH